ncbi:MAG: 16S rRNA (cytidine(1402)-2'-O)-methyltransferase [Patescibacteria group bacterium]
MLGTLYVVATPIGNLEDITIRALRIFSEVDYILCEDTRTTRKLLDRYEIKTSTFSYHQHSGAGKIDQLVRWLEEGKNLALVSDAGTPGISDPGAPLIAAVREAYGSEVKIEGIPGPSAVITALSISGWPVDRFSFLGFLPHKKGRQTMIKDILVSEYPVAVYESKHRILKLMEELDLFSSSAKIKLEVMLGRELTKMFESCYFGTPAELAARLKSETDMGKGEFVVLIRKIKK